MAAAKVKKAVEEWSGGNEHERKHSQQEGCALQCTHANDLRTQHTLVRALAATVATLPCTKPRI
jgi:hypothetical protein